MRENSAAYQELPPYFTTYLQDSLVAFSSITKVAVAFYDVDYTLKWESMAGRNLCNLSGVYQRPNSPCTQNLIAAMDFGATTGEPYIFVCHAGLIKIAVTYVQKGQVKGHFLAGPISMGTISESVLKKIFSANSNQPEVEAKLALFLNQVPNYQAKAVSQLSLLFNNCVLSSIGTAQDYQDIHQQHKFQVKLGVEMRKYKEANKNMEYPYQLEDLLFAKVKQGDLGASQKALHQLLQELALLESNDLSATKAHMLGVLGVLERMAFLKELPPIEYSTVYLLNEVTTFNELKILADGIVKQICLSTNPAVYHGDSKLIQDGLNYISENHKQPLSLVSLSEALHVNPSYLSTLFKREVGMTFSDYLNQVRVKQAEHLLLDTHKNLMDIALEVGFESQSYFSKVFKKQKGQTPKEYRTSRKTPK